ncbi:transcriptional regulator [Diplogelasinospora grovesii]|uniref:Transcriptional regulator n=1 Tax=Diplogelasinospora grovesii TaxID=303347 RepID=A0AAN6MW33_9PEZI|nr:transcriptional regulator [Diplogelasinospora grovesii]
MVFCGYCGKRFTRKEHLERHIPSHTNVKPHRCSACQLSFARRDLLQRHHSMYHDARNPRPHTDAGQTLIACYNCATAKAGCDKKAPCSRCTDKGIVCVPRLPRRASKAAVRAAQTCATSASSGGSSPQVPLVTEDQTLSTPASPVRSPSKYEQVGTIDTCLQETSGHQKQFSEPRIAEEFWSPHNTLETMGDIMLDNELYAPESAYQDLGLLDYAIELSMSSNLPLLEQMDMAVPPLTDTSDISSVSESITTSLHGLVHAKSTGISLSESPIREFEVIATSEAAWALARCNPSRYLENCPRTAIIHLERLEWKSKQEGTWTSLEQYLKSQQDSVSANPHVVPLTHRSRDKMLAIVQSFLRRALDIHRGGIFTQAGDGHYSSGDFNFIILPPSKVLQYFLSTYIYSLSGYYPLVVSNVIDPNEMLESQASTLLVLLMIAQGASTAPIAEARHFSAGLTETCRISLLNIVEKQVELSADPIVLRCGLLLTLLGAWSGEKWQMDIAIDHRGAYLSMLKHAGMLESHSPLLGDLSSPDLQWRTWLCWEAQNRLVYNWVMVDQELSLFYDIVPQLAVTDMQCPLPSPDKLWSASNSEDWLIAARSFYGYTLDFNQQLSAPSLYSLFRDFLHNNLSCDNNLSAQQLRLLLYPLQSLVHHLRQILSCFPDTLSASRAANRTHPITKTSTTLRLEEVQSQLQFWYELSTAFHKANPECTATSSTLVLYHLISLNATSHFPEVERLAREGYDRAHWKLSSRCKNCIFQHKETVFHCGQVLRQLRLIPAHLRPSWWGVALYRAVMLLWTDSISRLDPGFKRDDRSVDGPVPIDQAVPEAPSVVAYLWNGEGVATLTRRDGSSITLDNPGDILDYGIKMLDDEAVSSRIGDGIKRKLVALGDRWKVGGLGGSAA